MIHEEICTYEVCKLAREKGFPQHIGNDAYIVENEYDNEYEVGCHYPIQFIPDYLPTIVAPTQSLLQRWLREEKGVLIEVICLPTTRTSSKYEYKRHLFWGSDGHFIESEYGDEIFDTYELALEDVLKYALENLV
jgi:hypothetical protein